MARKKKQQADVGINMTPMIDVVFQLITFFMLASQFASAEIDQNIVVPDIEKSRAVLQEPKPPMRVVVNLAAVQTGIGADGLPRFAKSLDYIKVGPENIGQDYNVLRDRLKQAKARAVEQKADLVIIVRASRTLEWGNIQGVIKAAKGAAVRDLQLATPIGEYGASKMGS